MNIQHSSRSDQWGTPENVLELVHEFLGVIDLDPASSVAFNSVVQAKRILTKEDSALACDWGLTGNETIFLNPPGGKSGNLSNTGLFWKRLIEERENFSDAIFLGFSLECLQSTQNPKYGSVPVMDFSFCIPSKRMRFCYENGLEGPAPSHSNVLVWVPGKQSTRSFIDFCFVFESLGGVINGGYYDR